MPTKVLFIGDIFGEPGRNGTKAILPKLREEYTPDIVIANIENLAHGKGITPKAFASIAGCNIDAFTSGNHIWDKKEGIEMLLNNTLNIVRPANYPPETPGRGHLTISIHGKKILLINFIGRLLMGNNKSYEDPFRMLDEIIREEQADEVIVDFHGEATSEKKAFAWHATRKASLVVGTHTHIPTADAQILSDHKLGYVTDIGMVGSRDSIIGIDVETAISGFLTQLPVKPKISKSYPIVFNSIYAELDGVKTVRIERVDRTVDG